MTAALDVLKRACAASPAGETPPTGDLGTVETPAAEGCS